MAAWFCWGCFGGAWNGNYDAPPGFFCRGVVVRRCSVRPIMSTVRDGGSNGGDLGVLRCGECRVKTIRYLLGNSQERWMFFSEGFPLDHTCACAWLFRFLAPARVGARCMSLECIGISQKCSRPKILEAPTGGYGGAEPGFPSSNSQVTQNWLCGDFRFKARRNSGRCALPN